MQLSLINQAILSWAQIIQIYSFCLASVELQGLIIVLHFP